MPSQNLLEMVFDYQLLLSKRDRLGVPLDDDEQARWLALDRLLASRRQDADGGHAAHHEGGRGMDRVPFGGDAGFTTPGGFETGEVKNLCGSGVAIASARPAPVGSRVVLRLVDGDRGCEYFFPCRVAWSRRGVLAGMGLSFDGAPSRADYVTEENTGVWSRSVRMGTPPRSAHSA